MKIQGIEAIEILTTQGTPTVQVLLTLEDGSVFAGSTGYGTSRGNHEMAIEGKKDETLADFFYFSNFQSNLLLKTLAINDAIRGKEVNLEMIDTILCELDGTSDKSNLGMPLILGTSIAVAKAEVSVQNVSFIEYISKKVRGESTEQFSLPIPLINIINGGAHGQSSNLPLQEILLVIDNNSEKNAGFAKSILNTQQIFSKLKDLLKKKSIFYGYGLEGGISAPFDSVNQALDLLKESIEMCGLSDAFRIGVDCAAHQWYDPKTNKYSFSKQGKKYTSQQLMSWYLDLSPDYKIVYFEDPFAENDLEAWSLFKKEYPGMIVGDDLCVTQTKYIEESIAQNAINAVIIKPSQIGTVSETINAVKYAKEHKLEIIASHRSCETEDDFIVDFALGLDADFCKFGNITQANIIKYNKLMVYDFALSAQLIAQRMSEKQGAQTEEDSLNTMQEFNNSLHSKNEHNG